MLSKNSTLGMFAVLLFSSASLLFSQVDEDATTVKRAVRIASVDKVVRAQVLGTKTIEEDTIDEEVINEVTEEVAE